MTQPKTTAKKKATKKTETKMQELEKAGEAVLAKEKRKATKKAAKRGKAPAKKTRTKAKATRKPKTAARKTPKPDAPKARRPRAPRGQDPRIPPVGSTIVRPYKGKEIKVIVVEGGFRWGKQEFASLSAAAKAITGTKSTINGPLWFRLTEPTAAS